MRTEPPNLDREELVRLVVGRYDLAITDLAFVPVGECSYGYTASSPAGDLFLKLHRTARYEDVEHRLGVVKLLHAGHEGVVAPLRTTDGHVAVPHPVGPLAVFPRIAGCWLDTNPEGRSDQERAASGRLIGRLHAAPVEGTALERADCGRLPFAPALRRVLRGELGNGRERGGPGGARAA